MGLNYTSLLFETLPPAEDATYLKEIKFFNDVLGSQSGFYENPSLLTCYGRAYCFRKTANYLPV